MEQHKTATVTSPAGTIKMTVDINAWSGFYADNIVITRVDTADGFTPYRLIRAAPSNSLSTDADRIELELDNSDGSMDGTDIPPDARIRVFAWYGDIANEIQIFDGLIDRVRHTRHPHIVTISARDWMKKLIVQSVGLISSQDVTDTDAYVRDETNYVYLGWEISAIVTDLLDKAGFPADRRSITVTSVTVEEFRGNDDEPLAATIGRLADIVSYFSYADENGTYHFEPIDNTEGRWTTPSRPARTC